MLNRVIFCIQVIPIQPGKIWFKNNEFLLKIDEKEIEGSTTLFKTLLDRCEAKQKFILCEIIIRSNSSPRLAALIPQQEVLDEEVKSIQRCPPGFHLVYLPYADDFRQIERKIEAECNYFISIIPKLYIKWI
jgi:hypothetical protein